MSSTERFRLSGSALRMAAALLFLSLSLQSFAFETGSADDSEVWLVTYGPGELYWQRFGHNAIWVRDARTGLDHTFNFGFFDFQQQDFFLRFLMGRMLYFSAAQQAGEEFAQYVAENRSIRAQRLGLGDMQKAELIRFLVNEVRPENRDYLYDYYRNNCSTRVRDALDQALGGALGRASKDVLAPLSWRDHTRRLTEGDFWLYLGLETALGLYVDRPISLWAEMFIPGVLADVVATDGSLVLEDRMVFESSLEGPPDRPGTVWPAYLLASLLALAVAWLVSRWLPAALLARAWFAVAGLAGAVLLFFWFGTDHLVAGLNMNLFLLNPLWLAFALWRASGRVALQTVAVFAALAFAVALIPGQYTADVVAAFLPVNLVAAFTLYRSARPR